MSYNRKYVIDINRTLCVRGNGSDGTARRFITCGGGLSFPSSGSHNAYNGDRIWNDVQHDTSDTGALVGNEKRHYDSVFQQAYLAISDVDF